MSQWWTYKPRDLLMFSPDTYYRLFELENADIWPAQLLTFAAGLAILVLLVRRPPWAGRAIAGVLAACWAVVAYAYFFERYATINLAAPYLGWAFVAQAVLLLTSGVALGRLTFAGPRTWPQQLGLAAFAFALLLQPVIGPLAGRPWSGVELFGVAPDPTVLATLGILLAADRMRWELIAIPLLWCAVTGAILQTMGAPEALLLPAAGLATLLLGAYLSLRGPA